MSDDTTVAVDRFADLEHGAQLDTDRALWLINVQRVVGIERTPASIDLRLEGGGAVCFYVDGPRAGQIRFENWWGASAVSA